VAPNGCSAQSSHPKRGDLGSVQPRYKEKRGEKLDIQHPLAVHVPGSRTLLTPGCVEKIGNCMREKKMLRARVETFF